MQIRSRNTQVSVYNAYINGLEKQPNGRAQISRVEGDHWKGTQQDKIVQIVGKLWMKKAEERKDIGNF